MRIFKKLFSLCVFLLLLGFSLANVHVVTLTFIPQTLSFSMPLFVVFITALFIGVLIGYGFSLTKQRHYAKTRKALEKKLKRLEKEEQEA